MGTMKPSPLTFPAMLLPWRGVYMAENGHQSRCATSAEGITPGPGPRIVEFNWPLYVCKRLGLEGEADAYTVAVWKGTKLESVCLLQPLDNVLTALGRTLKSAGTAQYK
jgi:hypothetical protein